MTDALVAPILQVAGGEATVGARRVGELVAQYGWADGTLQSRSSQWRTYLCFCEAGQRCALPVTEAHLLAYIGWLADERDAKRRDVAPASLAQYLSCVRLMHRTVTGSPLPAMPYVSTATRAYAMWHSATTGPNPRERRGARAAVMALIWGLGMTPSADLPTLRMAALLTAGYCMGLRASSLASIQSQHVACTPALIRIRLSIWKGRPTRDLPAASYTRVAAATTSPLDLLVEWARRRPTGPAWFGLPGERNVSDSALYVPLSSSDVSQLLTSATQQVGHDPLGLSSHSLRIGAHTEQVLLGIPLEVRKARFGWSARSPMESVYLDRDLSTSPASSWFFGFGLRG